MVSYFNKKGHSSASTVSSTEKAQEERFSYSVDEPRFELTDDYRITVKGWILSKDKEKVKGVRLKNNDTYHDLPYGSKRLDVAQAFPTIDYETALHSGFESDIEFVDGTLDIEVDFGKGYEHLHKITLRYSGDKPLSANYNPHLASNWAEHVELLKDRSKYYFEESTEKKLHVAKKDDPRVVALYLPQFHPIPENDKAWGKGFTEWSNVTTAQARFVGHQQPMLPRDLGYYDLRHEDTIREQIELAKDHGLYGFCFYYYWFSGKKLLEKPLEAFMRHKEWDFNFMICWANENWTKRWDGFDNDVIVAQKYLEEDPLAFIKEVEHILLDPRYIRVDGKPVLSVYRPEKLKDAANYTKIWQDYFKKKHKMELHLVSFLGFDDQDPRKFDFNGAIDFVPLGLDFKAEYFEDNKVPQVNMRDKLLDVRFEGGVYDYRKVVLNESYQEARYTFPTYSSVMPSWDNEARKKGKGSAFYYVNPDLYGRWLERALQARESKEDLVFINAWNEWAEGAVLEPTMHFGHAVLNRSAEVIAKQSKAPGRQHFPLYGFKRHADTTTAVMVHLYYTDKWNDIEAKLRNLDDIPFDLFVSLQEKDVAFATEIKKLYKDAHITILPNRGRDILPFVHTARRLYEKGYTSLLKIHTKKSKHRSDGDKWFKELVGGLLASKALVRRAVEITSSSKALIGPKGHYISLGAYIGSNKEHVDDLLSRMYGKEESEAVLSQADEYAYFGGSMFWVSLEALKPLFELFLMPEDFEVEQGQIDGTMAHAVERVIGVIAQHDNVATYQIGKLGVKTITPSKKLTDYKYAK